MFLTVLSLSLSSQECMEAVLNPPATCHLLPATLVTPQTTSTTSTITTTTARTASFATPVRSAVQTVTWPTPRAVSPAAQTSRRATAPRVAPATLVAAFWATSRWAAVDGPPLATWPRIRSSKRRSTSPCAAASPPPSSRARTSTWSACRWFCRWAESQVLLTLKGTNYYFFSSFFGT